jgi:hypothetical protein
MLKSNLESEAASKTVRWVKSPQCSAALLLTEASETALSSDLTRPLYLWQRDKAGFF